MKLKGKEKREWKRKIKEYEWNWKGSKKTEIKKRKTNLMKWKRKENRAAKEWKRNKMKWKIQIERKSCYSEDYNYQYNFQEISISKWFS